MKEAENEIKAKTELNVKKEANVSASSSKEKVFAKTLTSNKLNSKIKVKTEKEPSPASGLNKVNSMQGHNRKSNLEEQSPEQKSTKINQFKIPKIKQESTHDCVKVEPQTESTAEAAPVVEKNKDFHKIVRFFNVNYKNLFKL